MNGKVFAAWFMIALICLDIHLTWGFSNGNGLVEGLIASCFAILFWSKHG